MTTPVLIYHPEVEVNSTSKNGDAIMRTLLRKLKLPDTAPASAVRERAIAWGETVEYANFLASEWRRLGFGPKEK